MSPRILLTATYRLDSQKRARKSDGNGGPIARFTGRAILVRHFIDFIFPSHLHEILLDSEVLDDELLPLGCVFAHEEGEQFVAAGEVVQVHRVEADGFADEVLELAGGDFAEAFEAPNLVAGTYSTTSSGILGQSADCRAARDGDVLR